jgi:hypothetical protein
VPIYPLFINRTGSRSYQIIVRSPLRLQSGRGRDEEIARGIEDWCAVLQEIVAQHWDQWFAFTPLFVR